ncbi:MAG: DUF3108 domain-containing protein [Weeksellaceae bacterium]|nr:DUF3108 domain-containing protein [Weeksellaceae bacterium]
MKNYISALFLSLLSAGVLAQGFQVGERLKYRAHYGVLNAGFAELNIKNATINGESHYHVVGKGWSTGAVRAFFRVDDRYETYINKRNLLPSRFIRDINEGGFTEFKEKTFDHQKRIVTVNNIKDRHISHHRIDGPVQDMVSAAYFLRSRPNTHYKVGQSFDVNIFMDGEVYPFRLQIQARERLKTRFGYINAIKFTPSVMRGRVFKDNESVTMWVSDDANMVPLLVQAKLVVGSLKMELFEYENLRYGIDFRQR